MTSAPAHSKDPQEVWDAVAAGWDRFHHQLVDHTRPLDGRLIELADVQAGEEVLELAAGLGELSRALAQRVGPTGRVICSDTSPKMIDAARRRSETSPALSFQVLDAQKIPLDDDSVDAIVCKMGLMLLPEPSRAASECRRVLRPGGRFVAATWAPLQQNLWIATFGAAMLSHGYGPADDPTTPGGIFSLSTPNALQELLRGAGFHDIEVEAVDLPEHVASFDEYWRLRAATSGPLTLALQQLEPEQVEAVRDTCAQYSAGLRQEDGTYVFPGQALTARAR